MYILGISLVLIISIISILLAIKFPLHQYKPPLSSEDFIKLRKISKSEKRWQKDYNKALEELKL